MSGHPGVLSGHPGVVYSPAAVGEETSNHDVIVEVPGDSASEVAVLAPGNAASAVPSASEARADGDPPTDCPSATLTCLLACSRLTVRLFWWTVNLLLYFADIVPPRQCPDTRTQENIRNFQATNFWLPWRWCCRENPEYRSKVEAAAEYRWGMRRQGGVCGAVHYVCCPLLWCYDNLVACRVNTNNPDDTEDGGSFRQNTAGGGSLRQDFPEVRACWGRGDDLGLVNMLCCVRRDACCRCRCPGCCGVCRACCGALDGCWQRLMGRVTWSDYWPRPRLCLIIISIVQVRTQHGVSGL